MAVLYTGISRYFTPAEWKKGLGVKIAYVIMHQADILLTSFALSTGFRELNPVIRGVIDTPVQLLAIKLLIPLIIAWLVPARLLLPALGLLLVVIIFNLTQLSSLL